MFKIRSLFLPVFLLVFVAATLRAQDNKAEDIEAGPGITFEELEQKIRIDRKPLERSALIASYADMLEKVTPGVVTVHAQHEVGDEMREMLDDPLFRRMFPGDPPAPGRATGSGVIITSDGYILTNNHVIEDALALSVIVNAKNVELPARLIVADAGSDVALLKVEATDLDPVAIGLSSKLRVGDLAFAVGNPFDLQQTVTMGIISALGRTSSEVPIVSFAELIQTDASINQGNSGGALVDAEGRLIGINTAIQAGMNGGSVGVGFAIPSEMALDIVDRLLTGGGEVKRGFLGVGLQPLDHDLAEGLGWEHRHGVVISEVVQGTPAADGGLIANDVIVAFEGKKALNLDSLRLRISNTPPDEEVEFEIFRDGETRKVSVTLAELPKNVGALERVPAPILPPSIQFIEGVEISDLTPDRRAELSIDEEINGVLVDSVEPDSAAAEGGLLVGQVIFEVNRKPIESLLHAIEARESFDGNVLLVRVSDGGARKSLGIRVAGEDDDDDDENKKKKSDESIE
ncbi:MAG: serine protease Do [Verrucomicrobiales bacterium]|jgi:serine protease Do